MSAAWNSVASLYCLRNNNSPMTLPETQTCYPTCVPLHEPRQCNTADWLTIIREHDGLDRFPSDSRLDEQMSVIHSSIECPIEFSGGIE